jgi:hypothetical protein
VGLGGQPVLPGVTAQSSDEEIIAADPDHPVFRITVEK